MASQAGLRRSTRRVHAPHGDGSAGGEALPWHFVPGASGDGRVGGLQPGSPVTRDNAVLGLLVIRGASTQRCPWSLALSADSHPSRRVLPLPQASTGSGCVPPEAQERAPARARVPRHSAWPSQSGQSEKQSARGAGG